MRAPRASRCGVGFSVTPMATLRSVTISMAPVVSAWPLLAQIGR
jgi:hypothetical protein